MLNQCILVGKVLNIGRENDKSTITLSISRNHKETGEDFYREDELDIELSDNLERTALEYLNVNATVGVKARIAQRVAKLGNDEIKLHAIVAEKLTFINAKND